MISLTEPSAKIAGTDSLNIEKKIHALMIDLGAMTHLKGFFYLCRAVEIVYYRPEAIHNVVKGLYSIIAEEFETTPACVERDIRTELKNILLSSNFSLLDENYSHFGNRSKSISARKFIALFAEKLRNDLIEPISVIYK